VIGSVRNKTQPSTSGLQALPAASGSKLILTSIESTSRTDPAKAIEEVQAAGINHVDIVIANAGWAPPIETIDTAQIDDVNKSFGINALGPLVLFQAVKPLLEKSTSPKWVSVSSAVATISALELFSVWTCAAYGLTKAAQNWFTV
jgi:NAD(P)-dependent dehydrogenase (short-subunit alcohol dehydrogenase family)